ncbi:GNAT family N-acetyltransferase [Streptomyces sp. CS227]|uniref:GNAT family N-acetyltransferase n=1 Tax=Streptomyces sp. CS227 TaxID=1982763 RepID=UPI00211AC7F7
MPEERNRGLGGLLIDAVPERAAGPGVERVTVHSSERAVPAYARRGFAGSPYLLQVDLRQGRAR